MTNGPYGMQKHLLLSQAAAKIWPGISQVISNQKSYPSHRACPACGEKTVYQASLRTLFTGLYTRTCSTCGYCDSKKVKMIRQL